MRIPNQRIPVISIRGIITAFLFLSIGPLAHAEGNSSIIGTSLLDQNRIDAIDIQVQSLMTGNPTITGTKIFNSSPTFITGITGHASSDVLKAGDTMTGSLFVSGSSLTVNGPIFSTGTLGGTVFSGAGTRFMWMPSSAAFRAGSVTGTNWNPANIGPASICFGEDPSCTGDHSFSGGGKLNNVSSLYGGNGSGDLNAVSGQESWNGGGRSCTVDNALATNGGGLSCIVHSAYGVNGGGRSNQSGESTSNSYTTNGGGFGNYVHTDYGTCGGGGGNTIGAIGNLKTHGTCGGGNSNTVTGQAATVPGGDNCNADGDYSFATGRRAKSTADGDFTFSDSQNADLTNSIRDQFLVRAQGGAQFNVSSMTVNGIILSSTTSPTFACNAGTPVPLTTVTNQHGTFAAGTGAANCTITFSVPWPKTPDCICADDSSLVVVRASAVSTTALTCTGVTISGDNITYRCDGAP